MSGEVLRSGEVELRASHADRDRVVDVLRIAAGDGRLTAAELDERLEAALTARTMGELAVLTADLPADAGGEVKDVVRIEQAGASAVRGDGWVVPRRLEVESSWGDVTLDFTDAVITYDTLQIDLDMQAGTLRLVTRPGVVVETDSLVVEFGEVRTRPARGSGTPVVLRVEIGGRLSYGKVVVRGPRGGFLRRARTS